MVNGTPDKTLKFSLGRWFGKERYITLTLPGDLPLTASQLAGWFNYERIEPYGEFRNELRHGQQMSLHLNLNRDPKQRSEPFNAIDLMNFVEKPPERILTPAEIEKLCDQIFG